jgi:hypothetical protein
MGGISRARDQQAAERGINLVAGGQPHPQRYPEEAEHHPHTRRSYPTGVERPLQHLLLSLALHELIEAH